MSGTTRYWLHWRGSRFRWDWALGFGSWLPRDQVHGLGFWVSGSGVRVLVRGCRFLDSRDSRLWVSGTTRYEADLGGAGLWASGVGSREIKFMISGSGYLGLVSGSLLGDAGFGYMVASISDSGTRGIRMPPPGCLRHRFRTVGVWQKKQDPILWCPQRSHRDRRESW